MNPDAHDRPRVVGIGECVVDQIFVIRDGLARYHATRGGGSVWNTLAHLAQAGYHTRACASAGNDPAGRLARLDLEGAGVDTAQVRLLDDKLTRVFTHYVHDDPDLSEGYPHKAFFTDCPVCGHATERQRLSEYRHDDFAGILEHSDIDLLCADHLNAQTARSAARLRDRITVLELNNYRVLTRITLDSFNEWHQAFRIISMPQQFAQMFRREYGIDFMEQAMQGTLIDLLVVGKGRRGAEIHGYRQSGERISLDIPAPRLHRLVDTAGAGDAMLAAILSGVLRQRGFIHHQGTIRIDPAGSAAITEAIHQIVTPVLQGIGARATLPPAAAHDAHLAALQQLRGKTINELKQMNAGNAHCMLCGM